LLTLLLWWLLCSCNTSSGGQGGDAFTLPYHDFLDHAVIIITITGIVIIGAVVVLLQEVSECTVCTEWQW
jgi:hypothetical protein